MLIGRSSYVEKLSEDLMIFLFDYLDYNSKIQFITTNSLFCRSFLKAARKIVNPELEVLTDPLRREQLLLLVEDLYYQLEVDLNEFLISNDDIVPSPGRVRVLKGCANSFLKFRSWFHRIRELRLKVNTRNENYEEILQYLAERNVKEHEHYLSLLHLQIEENLIVEVDEDDDDEDDEDEPNDSDDYDDEYDNDSYDDDDVDDDVDDDDDDDDDSGDDDFAYEKNVSRTVNNIFPYIPNLLSLNLRGIICLRNISSEYFTSLQKLTLKSCLTLKDVSGLGNIYDLTLDNCTGVSDISALQNNHTIQIINCEGISNISGSFRNSVKITLGGAFYIDWPTDLTCWSKVQSFIIKVSSWNPVSLLLPSTLRYCEIGFRDKFPQLIGYEKLRHLYLFNVNVIESFEGLGSIPILELRHVRNLISLEGLGKGHRKVIVEKCHKITDFSPLRFIETVEILECEGFTDITHVDHVRNLKLHLLNKINDYSALERHTEHLALTFRFSIASIPKGVKGIPIVEFTLASLCEEEHNVRIIELLLAENHQKIIFHFATFFHFFSLKYPPVSDSYHRTIFKNIISSSTGPTRKEVHYVRK